MSISLTPRLSAVASLVKGGGIIADIGTDHGYLPVYLLENGVVKGAIAADINKKPLENAEKAVKASGYEDKIKLRLSDGLNSFQKGEADEFIFAGMGGTLIAEKLREIPWVKDENIHFIFQPQSRAEDLREYLYSNGFSIIREIATHESRRYYIAFDAVYTGEVKPFTQGECFTGKLPCTEDAVIHLKKQLSRLEKRYDALNLKGEDTSSLSQIISHIKEYING